MNNIFLIAETRQGSLPVGCEIAHLRRCSGRAWMEAFFFYQRGGVRGLVRPKMGISSEVGQICQAHWDPELSSILLLTVFLVWSAGWGCMGGKARLPMGVAGSWFTPIRSLAGWPFGSIGRKPPAGFLSIWVSFWKKWFSSLCSFALLCNGRSGTQRGGEKLNTAKLFSGCFKWNAFKDARKHVSPFGVDLSPARIALFLFSFSQVNLKKWKTRETVC